MTGFRWQVAPAPTRLDTAHLFLDGRRGSVCGYVFEARVVRRPAPADRRCAVCSARVPRCSVCGRQVQQRADGSMRQHPTGARRPCSGTGQRPVLVALG